MEILAPDVYVNASVAPGTPPDRVVQRFLGGGKQGAIATEWVLGRVAAMLRSVPSFRADHIDGQVSLIRGLVQIVDDGTPVGAEAWEPALVAAAKAAKADRVITDHPDLLARDSVDGIEFMSTEAWLIERSMPPPPPPPPR